MSDCMSAIWIVTVQRTILTKNAFREEGLENQAGEYCFRFQCQFSATAASQMIWFPKKKKKKKNHLNTVNLKEHIQYDWWLLQLVLFSFNSLGQQDLQHFSYGF